MALNKISSLDNCCDIRNNNNKKTSTANSINAPVDTAVNNKIVN